MSHIIVTVFRPRNSETGHQSGFTTPSGPVKGSTAAKRDKRGGEWRGLRDAGGGGD